MTEIEKALRILERIETETTELMGWYRGSRWEDHFRQRIRTINTAQTILREKQQCEKGCEKCFDKDNLRWYKSKEFSVCPHCGRPLTEKNKARRGAGGGIRE